MEWLRNNAVLFDLIFSALVTVSTIVYAVLTYHLVRETIKMRRASTEPDIAIYLDKRTQGVIDLLIRNIGNGPAYNVSFTVEPDSEHLRTLRIFGLPEQIKYLPPDQILRIQYGTVAMGGHIEGEGQPMTITAFYYTKNGLKMQEAFVIDVSVYKSIKGTEGEYTRQIVKLLNDLVEATKHRK